MFQYSKSVAVLIGSASFFAILVSHPLKANELEEERGIIAKLASAPKDAWNALPDIKGQVQAKGTAFAKNQAEVFIEKNAQEIAKVGTRKFHALIYRHADLQVVSDEGEHIGWVEDVNSRVVRNFVKNTLGFDLDEDIPGVPSFMAKQFNNIIEKQLASYLEENVQSSLKAAVTKLSMIALQKGLGLAEGKVNEVIAKVGTTAVPASHLKDEVQTQIQKAAAVNKSIKQADLTIMNELSMAIQAKFKFAIHSWINQAANETAEHFIRKIVGTTGESMLRKTEVASGAVVTLAVGAIAGPTGMMATGGMIGGDVYVAEGAKEESYLRQAIKWLTNFDIRKEAIQKKATTLTTNQINARMDDILKSVGLGFLIVSDNERTLLEGEFDIEEVEEGFTNFVRVQEPYSFTAFASRIVARAKENAAATLRQVGEKISIAKKKAADTTYTFVDASEQFSVALNPMMSDDFWKDEPQTPAKDSPILKRVQEKEAAANKSGNPQKIDEARNWKNFVETELQTPELPPKKSWWKLW